MDRRDGGEPFQEFAQIKRVRGELPFAPHGLPFRYERYSVIHGWVRSDLGRQDCTTLCTTAGQNLTAVGSSHSLPETVDLGSVTAAGLIGTLHGIHLLNSNICSTVNLTAATHTF